MESLEVYLSSIAKRDLDQQGHVRPNEDVQKRLSEEIERISGCKCAHLVDAPAELLKPERIRSGHQSVFVSGTVEAVQQAAHVLRELGAKRFELRFTGEPNEAPDGNVQFRVRFDCR